MASISPNRTIVVWHAENPDLLLGTKLEDLNLAISSSPGIISSKPFLISEVRAAFQIESDIEVDHLSRQLSSIFGDDFSVGNDGTNDDGTVRLSIRVPSSKPNTQPASKSESSTPESQNTPTEPIRFKFPALPTFPSIVRKLRTGQLPEILIFGREVNSSEIKTVALLALASFGAVYFLLLRHLVGAEAFPNATDSFAHLFRASFVADEWKSGNMFPLWTPDWYLGTPVTQYYPPLTTLVLAPLTWMGDIEFAYKAFTVLSFGFASASVAILFRSRLGTSGALFAAIIYPISPFILRTTFSGGALPATLIIAIQPLVLRVLLDLIEHHTRRRFVFAAIVSAVAVLAHHLLAVMFFASISGGVVLSTIGSKRLRVPGGLALAALFVGIMITSWWLFSAQTSIEFDNVPKAHGLEPRFSQSRSFEIFDIGQRATPGEVYIGMGMLVLAISGFLVTSHRTSSRILLGAAGVSLFMTFGMNNPVITNLPLLDEFVFFERFLLTTSLVLALLAGAYISYLIHIIRRFSVQYRALGAIGGSILVLGLFWILTSDVRPYYTTLVRQAEHELWINASEAIDEAAPPGRIMDFVGRPEPAFFPYTVDRGAVTGWYLEGTSHWERIQLLSSSLSKGHYRFAERQLQQWWTAGAYSKDDYPEANKLLADAGFVEVNYFDPSNAGIIGWARENETSIISAVRRNATVVGNAHTAVEVVFPWASQTKTGALSDLSETDLSANQYLILAESNLASQKGEFERFNDFRKNDGVVLAVLGNDTGAWKADLSTGRVLFPDSFELVSADGEVVAEYTGLLRDTAAWEGLFIDDPRAETLLTLREGDFSVPLLSKYDDPAGPVYVLGAAYFNMVFTWPDRFSMDPIDEILARELPGLVMTTGLDPLQAVIHQNNSQGLEFDVQNPEGAARVVISTTYAPHWKEYLVDGEEVDAREFEGLVMLDLPQGNHNIQLRQGLPTSYVGGIGITIVVVAGLILFLIKPALLSSFADRQLKKLKSRFERAARTPERVEIE
jgi:hypothetical protein